jgi:hypothetical protein
LTRLSPLDASFLEVESPQAHMHVGWTAVFDPPEGRAVPSFEQMRDHISRRLWRAPRFRQRLGAAPLGLVRPAWVDDDRFDIDRHVLRSTSGDLRELTDKVMSTPLSRELPLWELWITELPDGRLGMVGKAHHCMVDGIAAVELATFLLDPDPDPPPERHRAWRAGAPPGTAQLLLDGLLSRAGEELELLLLTITKGGLEYSFLNAPVQLIGLRDRVATLTRSSRPPQLILRIGKGRRVTTTTPRRPLQDVLT